MVEDRRRRLPPRSLLGASVAILVAAVWLLLSPAFGHMGPPWPCAIAGTLLFICAIMLMYEPWQHVGWGVVVVAASMFIVLIGQGAILPGVIGAVGGVSAIVAIVNVDKNS